MPQSRVFRCTTGEAFAVHAPVPVILELDLEIAVIACAVSALFGVL